MSVTSAVKDNVRAVLLSKTDGSGILVSQFLTDYKKIIHQLLLYKNMGFPTLEDFIKAIPDVCRLEYSEREMAYKLFGISKPGTYVSSFTKKAEGGSKSGNGGSRDRAPPGKGKSDRFQPNEGLDQVWEPNNKGLYSLCFPRHKDPNMNTNEEVVVKFAKIGEVADVNITKGLIFVRYRNQEFAKTAIRMFGESLSLRRADERKSTMQKPEEKSTVNITEKVNGWGRNRSDRGDDNSRDCDNDNSRKNNYTSLKVDNTGDARNRNNSGSGRQKDSVDGMKSGFNKLSANKTSPGQSATTNKGPQTYQVYIGNWPYTATEDHLKQLLQGYRYKSLRIKNNGKKMFVFVDMSSKQDAERLITNLDKIEFHGRDLQVRNGHSGGDSQNADNTSMDSDFENLNVASPRVKHTAQLSPHTPPHPASGRTVNRHQGQPVSYEEEDEMPSLEPLQSPSMPKLEKQTRSYNAPEDDVMPTLEQVSGIHHNTSYDDTEQPESVQLFIGNFPYGTREEQLFELLSSYGVSQITMMNQHVTNRSTYAFATVDSIEQAQLAILSLDQSIFNGRRLAVTMANPSQKPASKTGFNQQLAKITCTVGEVGRKVSVEAPFNNSHWSDVGSYGNKNNSGDWLIQQLNSEPASGPPPPYQPRNPHEKHNAGNLRLHNVFSDYMKVVCKLRGEDLMWMAPNSTARVMVTHVETDKIFWAQLLENSQSGPNRSLETLEQIARELQKPDCKGGSVNRMGRCSAQFQGEWFRAWCTYLAERDGKQMADVMYIDYGNRALVPVDDLVILKPDMWRIPPMARPFKLATPWPELHSMVEKVLVLDVIEPASTKVTFMTTVSLR